MRRRYTVIGLVALGVGLFTQSSALAQEKKMTGDEYKAKVAEYMDREDKAAANIADCDARIASLKGEISGLEAEIASLNTQILRAVSASAAEVGAFGSKLDGFIAQLEGLLALAPEEIFAHRGEIQDVAVAVAEMKMSPMASLPEMADKIARIEALLMDLEGRTPRQISTTYEVAKGDHLWGIASMESIYDDPYMWPRIYRANRDAIADPDMIYPEQKLTVPYGVAANQYLVTSGDFLTKIATDVYDDPTQWMKIYKANMGQIVEPSLIFPAQVLEIPAN